MSKVFKPLVRIAAPVLGGIFGGPLGAAAGGALGSAATGGGGKDIGLSALLGGVGGLAAGGLGSVAGAPLAGGVGPTAGSGILGAATRAVPSIGSGLMSAGSALSGATGSLSGLLGTAAGTPLTGGLQGATQGSGTLGAITQAASNVPGLSTIGSGLSKVGSAITGGSVMSPLSTILGGTIQRRSADKQKDEILNQLGSIRNEYAPYRETGLAANERLSNLLSEGSGFGAPTEKFSMEAFQQDPGYQFRLQEGEKALNRRLASGGNYFSGDALKALQGYSQGLASQEYQDAFNRYETEAQRKAREEAQLYDMLYGQQNVGRDAAAQYAGTYADEALARASARAARDNSLTQMFGSIF